MLLIIVIDNLLTEQPRTITSFFENREMQCLNICVIRCKNIQADVSTFFHGFWISPGLQAKISTFSVTQEHHTLGLESKGVLYLRRQSPWSMFLGWVAHRGPQSWRVCCCCLGIAPRASMPGYFTLIGDKAPPAARDSSEVARALNGRCCP